MAASSPSQPHSTGPEPVDVAPAADALHFEGFAILPAERRLLVAGESVKIGARAFDLLLALVAARDRVVRKEELLERVWPGLVVEENNLSVHVSQLRKLCGPQAIATVPGRGYQFTATSVDAIRARQHPHPRDDRDDEASYPGPGAMPRGNLPAELPPLIGREAELLELREMLQAQRWVTITGAGGMGKTRLAEQTGLEAAMEMPTWLVELAAVSDARFVPSAVAQVLGATIVDTDRPLDAIVAALRVYLVDRSWTTQGVFGTGLMALALAGAVIFAVIWIL